LLEKKQLEEKLSVLLRSSDRQIFSVKQRLPVEQRKLAWLAKRNLLKKQKQLVVRKKLLALPPQKLLPVKKLSVLQLSKHDLSKSVRQNRLA
jgi:hypothetical protein